MSKPLIVRYRLASPDASHAMAQARELCVEQTVEFPAELLVVGELPAALVASVVALERDETGFLATIHYQPQVVGSELTQLLNVIFGNSSLKPGIRVEEIGLPEVLLKDYLGPRHGAAGLRALCGAKDRALLCAALKPMGLSPHQLAELAAALVAGGVDLIKDDHGLVDQAFCPFNDRVACCAEAVREANARHGMRARYAPNISADAEQLPQRLALAREAGVGAVMIAPGLIGWDSARRISERAAPDLAVLAHPALLGAFVAERSHGIAPAVLFGTLMRLLGADATIFPHAGGRFSFSECDCRQLAQQATAPLGRLRSVMPVPAGGMTVDRIDELLAVYGREVMVLIGGDLHREGFSGISRRVALLREALERRAGVL